MHLVAEGPQIIATTYCLTRFFGLRLDRTGPGPHHLVSKNAFQVISLMELVLGLIVPKPP